MKRTNRFVTVAAAVVLVAALAGCGVSTDAVIEALPAQTTDAPTTTAAPTSTTEAPTTTSESTTTEAPTTTEPPTTTPSTGGNGSVPEVAKAAFMEQCEAGGLPGETCTCIWDAIEDDLDVETLMSSGSSGTLPPDLQSKVEQAAMACVLGTD